MVCSSPVVNTNGILPSFFFCDNKRNAGEARSVEQLLKIKVGVKSSKKREGCSFVYFYFYFYF